MSQFELPSLPNDMPPELRDRLILQAKIDYILKTGGVVDLVPIENNLNTLKLQLNNVLSQVIGLEHNMDNVHNYDDTSIKSQLATTLNMAQNAQADVSTMQNRVGTLETTTNGHTGLIAEVSADVGQLETKTAPISIINNAIAIQKPTIELMSHVPDTSGAADYNGTTIATTLNIIELSVVAETVTGDDVYNPGHILMGAGDAGEADMQIYTETQVRIYNEKHLAGQIVVGPTGTSVAGVTITQNIDGIVLTGSDGTNVRTVTLDWDH
jgi:hypothetical protein